MLQQGADLNTTGSSNADNVFSEILQGYWWSEFEDLDACDDCEKDDKCANCEHRINRNPNLGESMCSVIRFFLSHGFDVNKDEGRHGAQCLYALTLSTFDRYMIEAIKILLDAGAQNIAISPDEEDATPLDFISTECSFQSVVDHDYALSNINEAAYQVYQAIADGRSYHGIDSYEIAIGKKILKVLAQKDDEKPVFYPIDLPEFQQENCFNKTLYFVYEGGVLIVTQYAELWTDTILPDCEMVDVSACFEGVVNSTITKFTHDYRLVKHFSSQYGQPIITLDMDSGSKVRFSINFGQVPKVNRAAFYEIDPCDSQKTKQLSML